MELVVTEVSQIQRYIFGSNRMRENVGASYLVTQATEGWALEAFKKAAPKNNLCKMGLQNLTTINKLKWTAVLMLKFSMLAVAIL